MRKFDDLKLGHSLIQTRPLGVKKGQYPILGRNKSEIWNIRRQSHSS